jgi:hypothetical protein
MVGATVPTWLPNADDVEGWDLIALPDSEIENSSVLEGYLSLNFTSYLQLWIQNNSGVIGGVVSVCYLDTTSIAEEINNDPTLSELDINFDMGIVNRHLSAEFVDVMDEPGINTSMTYWELIIYLFAYDQGEVTCVDYTNEVAGADAALIIDSTSDTYPFYLVLAVVGDVIVSGFGLDLTLFGLNSSAEYWGPIIEIIAMTTIMMCFVVLLMIIMGLILEAIGEMIPRSDLCVVAPTVVAPASAPPNCTNTSTIAGLIVEINEGVSFPGEGGGSDIPGYPVMAIAFSSLAGIGLVALRLRRKV